VSGAVPFTVDPAALADQARAFVTDRLLTLDVGVQAAALGAALLVFVFTRAPVLRGLRALAARFGLDARFPKTITRVERLVPPLFALAVFALTQSALGAAGQPTTLLRIAVSLAGAWTVIRFATSFITEPFWARAAAGAAWIGAGLNSFGVLDDAGRALDSIGFAIGQGEDAARLSLLILLRAAVLVAAAFVAANWLGKLLRRRIDTLPKVEPSLKILAGKTVQVALLAGVVMLGLTSLGIDLSAFALLGGAIGLGIGFGLQQIVANFIAGIILLLDRSIKPGDVLEIDGTYGWVNSLGFRYASVITRDGHEHLIPNENLMTEKVVNWSYSNKQVRIKRPIGIDYGADVDKAMALIVEAAKAAPRTLSEPAPKCLFVGFGESSIDLEVRFWIDDPENGVAAAASDVLLNIWRLFREHGVEIPFKREDIHLVTDAPIDVRVQQTSPVEASGASGVSPS
jgi:small-conductance mechanosensitive channel